jgi:predicted Zn-dependent protease
VPQGNLVFLVQHAVDAWAGLFLYNEFSGVLVSDSSAADVIVAWSGSVPADVPPDPGPPVPACQGLTNVPAVDSATNRLRGPFHVYLGMLGGYTPAQVQACLRRTAIHEVGHVLGLFLESPAPQDIMYVTPAVDAPSEQDRRTVEVLYHTPPTVLPPP